MRKATDEGLRLESGHLLSPAAVSDTGWPVNTMHFIRADIRSSVFTTINALSDCAQICCVIFRNNFY